MALGLITTALNLFGPSISKVIEKVIPDADKRAELDREIKLAMLEQQDEFNKTAADIVLAEAKSEFWLTANWRPLLMIIIIGIVAWNYLFVGIALTFGVDVMPLDLPDQLWTLLQIGVGGYVVGRSGEKMTKMWKEK